MDWLVCMCCDGQAHRAFVGDIDALFDVLRINDLRAAYLFRTGLLGNKI